MKNQNYLITAEIKGDPKGKKLFTVITVDKDDYEDSFIELWIANSEDHLYDLVKAEYIGTDTSEDDEDGFFMEGPMGEAFDDDWGFSILATEIGKPISIK